MGFVMYWNRRIGNQDGSRTEGFPNVSPSIDYTMAIEIDECWKCVYLGKHIVN